MARIAFYAPLKTPNHPTPSGDRKMARMLQSALGGAAGEHEVTLISELRTFEGKGDADAQAELYRAADAERARISALGPYDLWVTYHNYYKAPDLLGPILSQQMSIPYVLFEATRARKRLTGPWADFAASAEAANDAADLIFHFTAHDGAALHEQIRAGQFIAHLPPFLDMHALPEPTAPAHQNALLTVGMMRGPDKFASYTRLAQILSHLGTPDWTLTIIGDGPRRAEVEALFSRFAPRITFLGQLPPDAVAAAYREAAVFLWPGINEAYGMVYLEAQAAGCPVLAEDRPGVRDILPASALLPQDDPRAFAAQVSRLLAAPDARAKAATTAHTLVQDRHLFPAAQGQTFKFIDPLLKGR